MGKRVNISLTSFSRDDHDYAQSLLDTAKRQPVPSHVDHLDPCMIPTKGWQSPNGYFQVSSVGHRKRAGNHIGAHKLIYLEFVGPIPEDMIVCHKCDVPSCINPEHLFLGTWQDNLRDAAAKGRTPGRKITGDIAVQIAQMFIDGHAEIAIQDKFNVSYFIVHSIIKGDTWNKQIVSAGINDELKKARKRVTKSSAKTSKLPKISQDDINLIRELKQEGIPDEDIADELGIELLRVKGFNWTKSTSICD